MLGLGLGLGPELGLGARAVSLIVAVVEGWDADFCCGCPAEFWQEIVLLKTHSSILELVLALVVALTVAAARAFVISSPS